MTRALFRDDAYLRHCRSRVVGVADGKVVLDATVFYPTGGGQPGDTGRLERDDGAAWAVTDTRWGENGEIFHVIEAGAEPPRPGEELTARLDWERRYAHMRMHTCLHLLGAVLPYGVTGGQVGAEKSRLDFDLPDSPDKEEVTAGLNRLIQADHPVASRWITEQELDAQPELIRTMSVKPPRGVGDIRLLEIPGVDLQPCGGTHVKRTGEIGPVRVKKIEKKGRQNRRVQVVWAG